MAKLTLTIEDVEPNQVKAELGGDCGNPFNEEKAEEMTEAQLLGWEAMSFLNLRAQGLDHFEIAEVLLESEELDEEDE